LSASLADIGRSARYRVAPPGADQGDPATVTLDATLAGLALRPFAPVHVRARRTVDGVIISWFRRARLGADNWEIASTPLAEASERYVLRLFDGGALKHEAETRAPTFTLTPTLETALFGALQASLSVGVAQLSEAVGAGFERRASLHVGLPAA
jgi:hypothetical protein